MRQKLFSSGQSLVETALTLPIILVLLLGFFDLGRAIFYYSSLSNAVREGTRSGIVTNTSTGLKAKVIDYAFGLTTTTIPLTEDDIEVLPTLSADGYLETLQITATFCYVPVTPGIKDIIGNGCKEGTIKGIELTSESIMRYEPRLKP